MQQFGILLHSKVQFPSEAGFGLDVGLPEVLNRANPAPGTQLAFNATDMWVTSDAGDGVAGGLRLRSGVKKRARTR